MKIVNCQDERQEKTIRNILNNAIANSTALYDYQPKTLETIQDSQCPAVNGRGL